MHKRIAKLEYLAACQDEMAKKNAAKGEPNFNLHSVAAEQLRKEAAQLRQRAIKLASKPEKN
jgi:hypothetical protein